MATSNSALSSLEFHTQHASGSRDCLQPAAGESKPSPGQLRCCVVQQTSYLKGDSRREFFSSKDATKRKRVNRIAKLKQCKLDARREQWLSQGVAFSHASSTLEHSLASRLIITRWRTGSRCRPEEHRQVAQYSTRKEEKYPSENTKAGKDATAKEPESNLHRVESSEVSNKETIITKQNDVSIFPTPCVVGSHEGHANITQTLKVKENGNPELPPRASQDDDSYKPGPGDPDSSAWDCEQARRGGTNCQCYSEASGNIRCADIGYVPDFVRFRTENSQRCSESPVVRPDLSLGGSKLLNEEKVVVSQRNVRNGCTPGCRTDQALCSSSSCANSSIAETGFDVIDLSFTHETEDDWELAADALSVAGSSLIKCASQLPDLPPGGKVSIEQKVKVPGISNLQDGILKPEYKCKASGFGIKSRDVGGRAWRPDDVSRPPTLPQLSKQLNSPHESSASVWSGTQQSHNLWGPPPVPAYCPICTEELDLTDSSFFPCSCGFRLCLFCHHRISSDDGRCPGCRKIYSSDVAMKLSRTTFWLSV